MSNPKHQVTGDSLPKGLAKTIYEQAKQPKPITPPSQNNSGGSGKSN
ncbi:MAG: hypothetical protein ACMX3H_10515 [Sodalis sp. (in: enterobacteria)]